VEHPILGTVRHVCSPLRLASRPPSSPQLAPRRAEHQQAVLVELCGYREDRIKELASAGAFGAMATFSDQDKGGSDCNGATQKGKFG
jgi:hypothetical protein